MIELKSYQYPAKEVSIAASQVMRWQVALVRSNLQHTIVPPCQLAAYHKAAVLMWPLKLYNQTFQRRLILSETTLQTQGKAPGRGGALQGSTPLPSGSTSTTRQRGSDPERWREKATGVRGGRRPGRGTPRTAVGSELFHLPTPHTDAEAGHSYPPPPRGWARATWPAPAAPGSWRPSPGPARPWLPL